MDALGYEVEVVNDATGLDANGLGYTVDPPPPHVTPEAVCKQLLGSADWRSNDGALSPSQYVEAIAMLNAGWPAGMVNDMVEVLTRWGWFKQVLPAGKAPWEVTDEDWEALVAAKPWERPGQQRHILGAKKETTMQAEPKKEPVKRGPGREKAPAAPAAAAQTPTSAAKRGPGRRKGAEGQPAVEFELRAPALAAGTEVQVSMGDDVGMLGTVVEHGIVDGQGRYMGEVTVEDSRGERRKYKATALRVIEYGGRTLDATQFKRVDLGDAGGVIEGPAEQIDKILAPPVARVSDRKLAPPEKDMAHECTLDPDLCEMLHDEEPSSSPQDAPGTEATDSTTEDAESPPAPVQEPVREGEGGESSTASASYPVQDNPPPHVIEAADAAEQVFDFSSIPDADPEATEPSAANAVEGGNISILAVRIPQARMEAIKEQARACGNISMSAFINAAIEEMLKQPLEQKMETLRSFRMKTSSGEAIIKKTMNRVTRTEMVVADTWHPDVDINPDDGRWAAKCVTHGKHVAYGAKQAALGAIAAPWNWCGGCKQSLANLGVKS